MNFIFDILIPRGDIDKLGVTELVIKWGEEVLSQDPRQYEYKSKMFFHENVHVNYYNSIMQNKSNSCDYIVLTLEGALLSDFEFIVNKNKEKILNNEIVLFLTELFYKLNNFYIFLFRDEECIDKRYTVGNVDELIRIFSDCFIWTSPEGIIITKSSNHSSIE